MKATNILVALFFTMLLTFSFSVMSFATVVNSPHNLTRRVTTTQNDEVCIYCHTPHHAKSEPTDYNPLWSAGVQTSETFIPYSSSTLDAVIGDPLIGPSRLCISCHDGTIAVDIALAASTCTRMIIPPKNIGGLVGGGPDQLPGATLTSDHPVGFDYIAVAAADDEILPATSGFSTGMIADFLFTSGAAEIMTCATCHDVHEWGSGGGFLRVENTGSALCLNCHMK